MKCLGKDLSLWLSEHPEQESAQGYQPNLLRLEPGKRNILDI